jgi:hypothetical protein
MMMVAAMEARFACEECGKSYRWQPQLAGRVVKCACGKVMTAPPTRPDADGDLYDFAEDVPSKQRVAAVARDPGPMPTTPAKAGEGAVASFSKTIEYQKPTTPGNPTEIDRLFPDRVRDLYMPLVLIGAGTLVHIIYAMIQVRGGAYSLPHAMTRLCWSVVVDTAMMLVAILIAGKARGINFGPLPVAIIKLCAVSLTPSAVAIVVLPFAILLPFLGWILAVLVQFCAYFAVIGALFDLDQNDTWYCICVIFIVNVSVYLVQIKFW